MTGTNEVGLLQDTANETHGMEEKGVKVFARGFLVCKCWKEEAEGRKGSNYALFFPPGQTPTITHNLSTIRMLGISSTCSPVDFALLHLLPAMSAGRPSLKVSDLGLREKNDGTALLLVLLCTFTLGSHSPLIRNLRSLYDVLNAM